jgi:ATP-binding cassette, subfamily B, bacterial
MADGFETMVGPRGVRLSGGQVQRSAAARMLVRSPRLLIFDDLSSALDVETEAELWDGLFARGETTTVLAVSHRRPALKRADQVIVMDEGRVVATGKAEELMKTSLVFREMWAED